MLGAGDGRANGIGRLKSAAAPRSSYGKAFAPERDEIRGNVRCSGSPSAVNDYPDYRLRRIVHIKQRVCLYFVRPRLELAHRLAQVADASFHFDHEPARLARVLQTDIIGFGVVGSERGATVAVNAYAIRIGQIKRDALLGASARNAISVVMAVQSAEVIQHSWARILDAVQDTRS